MVIWNKGLSTGALGGWFSKACKAFTINPGETVYYAFDADSQGGWAAARGDSIPTDYIGQYAATWGEFDFGSSVNRGWSGFDVSAIKAQSAGVTVQGMRICSVLGEWVCSVVRPGLVDVRNAYTAKEENVGGIGGNLGPGPVRLEVQLDYRG